MPHVIDARKRGALTYRQIAAELNARGIETLDGRAWNSDVLRGTLRCAKMHDPAARAFCAAR